MRVPKCYYYYIHNIIWYAAAQIHVYIYIIYIQEGTYYLYAITSQHERYIIPSFTQHRSG